MFAIIQSWCNKNVLRKNLLAFLNEMDKNLEFYYVTDQRQFMTGSFFMDAWEKVKDVDIIKKHEAIRVYEMALLDFNKAYKEHKSYEQWYTSDTNNKTPDNAKKLHALKYELDQKLKPLEAIIISAGQALEKELLNLGFISN